MGECVSTHEVKTPSNLEKHHQDSTRDPRYNSSNHSNQYGDDPSPLPKIPKHSHHHQQVSIDSVSTSSSAVDGIIPRTSKTSISTRATSNSASASSASTISNVSATLDSASYNQSVTHTFDTNTTNNADQSMQSNQSFQAHHHRRYSNVSLSNRSRSNTLDIIENELNTIKIFNYSDQNKNNLLQKTEGVNVVYGDSKVSSSKTSSSNSTIKRTNSNGIEIGYQNVSKAKIVCFKDVNSDRNDEDITKRECKVWIEDNETKILFLSCYDPICWVLDGEYLNNIEKIVICETKHSNLIRECWYPDGSLPRVKGIEKLNKKCQIGLEMGFQSRYSSDFKASYYSQSETKQKRSKLMNYLEDEYKCKVVQIIQSEMAPSDVTV